MPSNRLTNIGPSYSSAYVWIWLPGETEPVVAGKLETDKDSLLFNYGKSYLERIQTGQPVISLYDEELPLHSGVLPLLNGLKMPGCIRDAAPDAWGRRVIINKLFGFKKPETDLVELSELTYLLTSSSDRIGALDFQSSPTEYIPRSGENATLEELLESAKRIEEGTPLTPELNQALLHGSAIGGARPKVLIQNKNKKYVAKFSSSTDTYSVVKAEFIAMKLANIAGLNVAPVELVKASGKDVLLIERFDRIKSNKGWERKIMLSALTLLGLEEMLASYASYEDLAEIIRRRFTQPKQTLRELYSRMVFNILCGNTDDHARNHAAFWDGKNLALTPAYDICPQNRAGNEATQGMRIHNDNRFSQIKVCLESANNFMLPPKEAKEIADYQKDIIEKNWKTVCDEAELSEVERNLLWERQFLNPFCFWD
jgi:serine/threonine-protein kinase HipA